MSGNQQGTPGRSSIPSRLSATPMPGRISAVPSTPQSSSNPRPQMQQQGASGRPRVVNTPLPPSNSRSQFLADNQAVVLANRSRPQQRLQPAPPPRFTIRDPAMLARIMAMNFQTQRTAASGPTVPIVQTPGPTPAPPQFVLPGQSSCRPPNPSYHYEQVTRALTKPHQTVPRHFCPVISAGTLLGSAGGRTASLDRSASRGGTGLLQGITPQSVSLLGSHVRRDQSTPPTISLDAASNFLALAKPGAAEGVGLQGQVAVFSDQPRHSEVIDRMFHQPLPNMPAMMTGKSTDYSSTHKMAVTRNYFKGTEEVTYEQSMQHQPPPVPNYYPPMAAGSSAMSEQYYDVGGQQFSHAEIEAARAQQQQADQHRLLLEAAAAIVLQHQQQQDEASGDRANELLQEESAVYHRRAQERKQQEEDEVDRAQLRFEQDDREPLIQSVHEEDQLGNRLRRVSASSQRPTGKQTTPVDQSIDMFASLSYRKGPTLNQLNSLEGSIADDASLQAGDESSQHSETGNLDGVDIVDNFLDETSGRFIRVIVKAGDDPTAACTSGRHSPGRRSRNKGERGMLRLTNHLVQASDSDSDSSERPKDKKVERKAVQKLAFNRDVWPEQDYSDGETDLKESQADTGALPPGFVPIPKYDCVLPRYISAGMLTEMLEGVTPADLAMIEKVVRDNIIGQLDMMNRADVPTIDRPKLTQAEINSKQFLALLDDTNSYQLGMPLPDCIVLPPMYRKIDYYRERCAAGLHEFSEAVRAAGAYIYTFLGLAARRNLKGFGKVRKLRMEDYFEPDEFGHVLPSFSRLKQASSGTEEAFVARSCTQEISKLVAKDPEKYRDLLNALQDVGGKFSKCEFVFKDGEGKPVRILVPEVLAEQIWEAYPDLHIFNREFWRYLQANHDKGLVLASYNISQSLINRDQQVAYLGQTNKRGYLGLAYGQQSSAIMPKSTVRMFGHMTPFIGQPGNLVRHSVQHSGRTVNITIAAEHVEQAISIERSEIFPAEYTKCPSYHLHAKYYNPMLLVEKSGGKIQVAMALLNVGDMLTVLERAMTMQISLGPGETANTVFLGAYNKTVALSLTTAKREATCLCPNNKKNALLAAETPGRLDAAFHFLASDYTHVEMPDEPENVCWPCGLYPVGSTWKQRHGQFENHMKAAFDPVTGRAIRDACPDPMGLVPVLKRANLTASYTDRRTIEAESKISASVEASSKRPSGKGRGKKKAEPTTPRISIAGAKPPPPLHHKFRKPRAAAKSAKALSIKPPKAKRPKKEVKKDPSEDQEDAEDAEEREDAESGNDGDSESDGEMSSDTPDCLYIDEGVEAKPGRKRKAAKKSPIIEEPEDEEKVETAAKEPAKRKRPTKPIAPPSDVEPATASTASNASKRPKRTPKKADEKAAKEETEKDTAPVEPEKEAAKPATRASMAAAAAAAKPATSQRAKRTNELDALLKCGVNGKPESDSSLAYDVEAAERMATERGLRFWTDIPTAEVPIKPAVVSSVPIPKPMFDSFVQARGRAETLGYDVAAAEKLAKERGLISWAYLPHSDIPTKSTIATPAPIPTKPVVVAQPAPIPKPIVADDSTPGTSTRRSAIKKTPAAALKAAKKTDQKAAKGKKGLKITSKAAVSDDDDSDDSKANGDNEEEDDRANGQGGGGRFRL